MPSLRAHVRTLPAMSQLAMPPAAPGDRLQRARHIRRSAQWARRCRYHVYRIAGIVVLVAGSWAG